MTATGCNDELALLEFAIGFSEGARSADEATDSDAVNDIGLLEKFDHPFNHVVRHTIKSVLGIRHDALKPSGAR